MNWSTIGNGLADWYTIEIGLADWFRVGRVEKILSLAWHLVGHGLSESSLAETRGGIRIVLVPSDICALSVRSGSWLARIGVALAAGYLIGRLVRRGWLRIGWTRW